MSARTAPRPAGADDPTAPETRPAAAAFLDPAVVLVLIVASAVLRLRTFPTDGLWHDDTWVAAGAKAPVGDLWAVATNHPGFTLLLMGWRRVVSTSTEGLVTIGTVVGITNPALLYAVLRALRHTAAVSALLATLLLTCETHVQYSTRLKPYSLEIAVILVTALVVPVLARRRWSWTTAAAWTAGAVVAGSVSAFAMVAVAVAALVLALHPHGDRVPRVAALAVQGGVQLAMGLKMRASYDTEAVADDWEQIWDSYVEPSSDVVGMARDVLRHSARLGQAFVGGGKAVGLAVVVAAVAGLVWSAVRGRHRLVSRYLLGLLAVAFVGGLTRQVPFGPDAQRQIFPGGRASLWLIPSLAVGLAVTLDEVARALARAVPALRHAVPALAVVALVALGLARHDLEVLHADTGVRTATEYVERHRDADTVVLVFPAQVYAIASAAPVPFDAERGGYFGFRPRLTDRVEVEDPEQVPALVGDARQVILHSTFAGLGDGARDRIGGLLAEQGFEEVAAETFLFGWVERWERGGPGG